MTSSPEVRILGVDPGVSGGAAIFCPGSIVKVPPRGIIRIPTRQIELTTKSKKTGKLKIRNVVDGAAFLGWVQYHQPTHAFVEQVWAMPTKFLDDDGENIDAGQQATFNFGRAYGSILTVLECFGLVPVDVPPQRWQQFFQLHKLPKDTDKGEASRLLAIERHPSAEPFIKYKKDHNGAEALLVGEYGASVLERQNVDDIEE